MRVGRKRREEDLEGKEHAHQTAGEVHAREAPAHADGAVLLGVGQGEEGQSGTREQHQSAQCARAEAADEERIEDVADILEEERPARAVEGEHLGIAPHLIGGSGPCGDKETGCGEGQQHGTRGNSCAVPLHGSLQEEGRGAQERADDNHRVEADQSPAEEAPDRQAAAPAVVVGVGDDESREHEEEIDGQIAVRDALDGASAGKGVAFEDVVPDDRQGGDAAQSVEDFVVGFRVGERGRRSGNGGRGGRCRGCGGCLGSGGGSGRCRDLEGLHG